MRKHVLVIKSLHDAQAECSCGGWFYSFTGEQTKTKITRWHRRHARVGGFTLLEAVLSLLLVGILVAVALPRLTNLLDAGQQVSAVRWNDVARAALNLDFAKQKVETGQYVGPFRGRTGRELNGRDRRALEQLFDLRLLGQGQWILVTNGDDATAAEVRFSW